MSAQRLTCDQAIFTSIRTPMGEGYRIVSASRGLNTAEKQTITRNSPSHESLCTPPDPTPGGAGAMSFYAMPTGRLCVSVSLAAGAEHTGRGGDRVYTHCAVLTPEDFARGGYDAFAVVAAMHAAGLTTPQLKPPPTLPPAELDVDPDGDFASRPAFPRGLDHAYRGRILETLLADGNAILDLPADWGATAQTILLGLPAAERAGLSFSVGMKYSSTRRHRFQVLHDEKRLLRDRLASESVLYLNSEKDPPPPPPESAWVRFVERHWNRQDLRGLAARTRRIDTNLAPAEREALGILFGQMDDLPRKTAPELLRAAGDAMDAAKGGPAASVREELLASAGRLLAQRVAAMPAEDLEVLWLPLLALWQRHAAGTRFATPLIEQILQKAATDRPATAAELARHLARDVPAGADPEALRGLIDNALQRFAAWTQKEGRELDTKETTLIGQWRRLRPNCPIVNSMPQPASAGT